MRKKRRRIFMNRSHKLSIILAVISALSIGFTSFAQNQQTKQTPMGQQTTKESNKVSGLTRQPVKDNQGQMQNQNQNQTNQKNQNKMKQNQNMQQQKKERPNQEKSQQKGSTTGGASGINPNQQQRREQQGTTVRGYW